MIRHIVFFSAVDPQDVERIREGLMMLAEIPHSSHFEVGRNLQSDSIPGGRVDLVVYGEFADEAALAAYKAHPSTPIASPACALCAKCASRPISGPTEGTRPGLMRKSPDRKIFNFPWLPGPQAPPPQPPPHATAALRRSPHRIA